MCVNEVQVTPSRLRWPRRKRTITLVEAVAGKFFRCEQLLYNRGDPSFKLLARHEIFTVALSTDARAFCCQAA